MTAFFLSTGASAEEKLPPPELVPKALHMLLPLSIKLEGWQEAGWLDRLWYLHSTAWHFTVGKDPYFGDFYLIKDALGLVYPEASWTMMVREHPIFKDSTIVFGTEDVLKTTDVTYRYIPFRVSQGQSKAYCLYTLGLWKPGFLEGFLCHPSQPFTQPTATVFLKSIGISGDVAGTEGKLE